MGPKDNFVMNLWHLYSYILPLSDIRTVLKQLIYIFYYLVLGLPRKIQHAPNLRLTFVFCLQPHVFTTISWPS